MIARKITGARWSGPRFFGLRRQPLMLILVQGRRRAMAKADLARTGSTIRCAIYTRKSSDEGLEAGIQFSRRPAGRLARPIS